jgi:hypothetical protein
LFPEKSESYSQPAFEVKGAVIESPADRSDLTKVGEIDVFLSFST